MKTSNEINRAWRNVGVCIVALAETTHTLMQQDISDEDRAVIAGALELIRQASERIVALAEAAGPDAAEIPVVLLH